MEQSQWVLWGHVSQSVVRAIPLAINTRIAHFLTAWLEFHISVLHIQMEILHVQTHSHLTAHNVEPGVTQPANCPWKILVCLTIMHATFRPLCWPYPLHAQFQPRDYDISKTRLRSVTASTVPEIFSSGEASPSIYIQRHYPVLDVLSLVGKCLGSYWDLLMEHRQ